MYTLWNNQEKRAFRHPDKHLVEYKTKDESEQALSDLFDYLRAVGLTHLIPNFRVVKTSDLPENH